MSDNQSTTIVLINLTKGQISSIDALDSDLAKYNWCVTQKSAGYYAQRRANYRLVYLHRVILERMLGRSLVQDERVDHINRNTLDNRRSNLRLATVGQNSANTEKPKTNTSGAKGISWRPDRQKWTAKIEVNHRQIYLGIFTTIEEAKQAYKEAAIRYFGEFAHFD